jgi:hypothetical protein
MVVGQTVGTSASTYATGSRSLAQRKTFYANGRFWVFYYDDTYMVYRTSTDGSTWSSASTIARVSSGSDFSVFFDGTYLHYVRVSSIYVYYRRGVPSSAGSISWSAAEQTVYTDPSSFYVYYPNVVVDSGGYPWVSFHPYDGTNGIWYCKVSKSSTNDGTWVTASGFPYSLGTGYHTSAVLPLTSSKVYVLYCQWSVSGGYMYGILWNGAWGSTETVASNVVLHYWSAVAQGDYVHVAYLAYGYNIVYRQRTTSWQTAVTVQSSVTSTSAPTLSIDSATGTLYCFWAGSPTADHIYYKKRVSGTWDSSPTDWIAETETLTNNAYISSFYQAYGSKIGLLYMTKTSSPYNVKFAYISLAVAYTITLTESLGLKDSVVKASSVVRHEFLGLSDVYGRTWAAYRTYTEPLGLSDAVAKNVSVAKAESLGLSDIVSSVRLYAQTLTELLGLSDFVAKAPSVVRAESLGLLDSYSRLWSVHRTYSENLGLTDYVQKSPSTVKFEPLGLSDVVQKSSSILKSELLGLSDFYSRTWTAYRTYTESLGLSDKVSKTATVPLAEALGLFDTVIKSSFITKAEKLGLADFTTKGISVAKTERLGLSDVLRKATGKTFSEPLGLKDTYSRVFSVHRTFTESLGLKDTVSKGVTLHALTEVLGLIDRLSYCRNPTVISKIIRKLIQVENILGREVDLDEINILKKIIKLYGEM